jgi:molecular chaperone DnaK
MATRSDIESAIKETREALAGDDVEEIKRKQEALLTASHKLSEVLYSQAQEQQASQAGGSDPDDDVVEDAEIVDDEDEAKR